MTIGDIPPPNDQPIGPQPEEPYWTNARKELRDWLRRNAPSLAQLYEGSVSMLYDRPLPGRMRFICVSVREIRNRLPDYIAATEAGGYLQYKNRVDAIAREWRAQGYMLDLQSSGAQVAEGGSVPSSGIAISPELYRLIAELLLDHDQTRERPIDTARRLFEGCAPENREQREALKPVLVNWVKTTDWFADQAHDNGKTHADCDWSDVRSKFELFEMTLGALVRGFYQPIEGLDDILEDTNR